VKARATTTTTTTTTTDAQDAKSHEQEKERMIHPQNYRIEQGQGSLMREV
jgi:hypothetical protein